MNGFAFANMPGLGLVDLRHNVCIDKLFATESALKVIGRKISRNCATADAPKRRISCRASTACSESLSTLGSYLASERCCQMEFGTYIDSPNYSFVADTSYEALKAIVIIHQRNIEYLPVKVHERFPNLKTYFVGDTIIRKISKKNFEALIKLETLFLESNQIELIKSDTFEDLISLERIYISTGYYFQFRNFLICFW